jgi:uncharacterized protein YndB with AHSA1/START domain
MSTVAVTRLIEAPVAEVWRVFTDLSGRCEWLSAVTRVEILTTGAFAAGTTWRETRTMPAGEEVTEEFHVQELVPFERFVVASPGIGADYRMTYTFEPVLHGRHSGATSVTAVQEGHATAASGHLLSLVFGGLAARTLEGALRRDLDDLAAAVTTRGASAR